jgi:hypothetical protein
MTRMMRCSQDIDKQRYSQDIYKQRQVESLSTFELAIATCDLASIMRRVRA